MQIHKLNHIKSHRLVLCFAGWSASPEVFARLQAPEDTDVWICYDYRDLSFSENLSGYTEINLVAWSLGVWVSNLLWECQWQQTPPAFRHLIAVNGTGCPISDTEGIPEIIFRGTMDNLNPEGLQRFIHRMCKHRDIMLAYRDAAQRPEEEIGDELRQLYQFIRHTPTPTPMPWTHAILSRLDRIFPFENMLHYWQNRCLITEIEAPHYPFYLWNKWGDLWKQ